MPNYGRNFEYRVQPHHGQRGSRFATEADQPAVPIGAPVTVVTGEDTGGRAYVRLATGAQAPEIGMSGIAVFEHGPDAFAGVDPQMTTYSDFGDAPVGAAVQMVSGPPVKVVLRNTAARTFLTARQYAARVMVAPANLAGLAVGDYLTPGVGSDAAGYWAETALPAEAWLVITKVDTARGEVEAKMLF